MTIEKIVPPDNHLTSTDYLEVMEDNSSVDIFVDKDDVHHVYGDFHAIPSPTTGL